MDERRSDKPIEQEERQKELGDWSQSHAKVSFVRPTSTYSCGTRRRGGGGSSAEKKASVLMQRLSYPTETVLSNEITRN